MHKLCWLNLGQSRFKASLTRPLSLESYLLKPIADQLPPSYTASLRKSHTWRSGDGSPRQTMQDCSHGVWPAIRYSTWQEAEHFERNTCQPSCRAHFVHWANIHKPWKSAEMYKNYARALADRMVSTHIGRETSPLQKHSPADPNGRPSNWT